MIRKPYAVVVWRYHHGLIFKMLTQWSDEALNAFFHRFCFSWVLNASSLDYQIFVLSVLHLIFCRSTTKRFIGPTFLKITVKKLYRRYFYSNFAHASPIAITAGGGGRHREICMSTMCDIRHRAFSSCIGEYWFMSDLPNIRAVPISNTKNSSTANISGSMYRREFYFFFLHAPSSLKYTFSTIIQLTLFSS